MAYPLRDSPVLAAQVVLSIKSLVAKDLSPSDPQKANGDLMVDGMGDGTIWLEDSGS